MSLNDIRLTPSITAGLFRSSLIETDEYDPNREAVPKQSVPDKAWKFLGNNGKKILVVVDYNGCTHLPDEELLFLTNILAACKLTLGDVAIVNMKNYPGHSYKEFIDHFSSNKVLLFGIGPLTFGLPISFPYFQVQAFSNCDFLYSPPLDERNNDPLFKSKLWVSLRRIFGI
jgi:hypothetical protein